MRSATTILNIIHERGKRKLPINKVYRLLYQRDIYLMAYGKLSKNKGVMTKGITEETIDGMTLKKIDQIIETLRHEKYRWSPVRRIYILKKNNKHRTLGLPTWTDKILQEVIRLILEAYYEPKFSEFSHGFKPQRGCHTALKTIKKKGIGTKWFIEGDLKECFDSIDHSVLLNILGKDFHDKRFIQLISRLLKAGYIEQCKHNESYSGVPQGSIIGSILSNILLDQLDKYVENTLIPENNQGKLRKNNPEYNMLLSQIAKMKEQGNWTQVLKLRKQLQTIPSRDPNDPNFRHLWYMRYADDFLLGFIGPKSEAIQIKDKIAKFINEDIKLTLNQDKTLITHAKDDKAKFLGYEIHVLQNDNKHKHGARSINRKIGLRIPQQVKLKKCVKYKRFNKPIHLPQRITDTDYNIINQYQSELRGIVQYYQLAYNLHTLRYLIYVMGLSLVKTLAAKYKTSCMKIWKKFTKIIKNDNGKKQKVILTETKKVGLIKPITTYFGAISLKWNKDNLSVKIILNLHEINAAK